MSTYLELCQSVAQESGTVSGTQPGSVTGVTGRLAKIVRWTAQAWVSIQNLHPDWKWLQEEATGETLAGTARYTAASFSLARFGAWIEEPDNFTIYKTADGVAEEARLIAVGWQEFRRRYLTGTPASGAPRYYAISPKAELCLAPVPDDAYTLRFEYRTAPQVLAANSDTPEMPARFHELIVHKACLLLAEHDEGVTPITLARMRYRELLGDLRRDQLPTVGVTREPLA